MAFSLIYPTGSSTPIPRTLFVLGTLGPDALTVNGRLIRYGPTTVRYPNAVLYIGSNIWIMTFKNLESGAFYDLQITDQNGTILTTLERLEASGPLTAINILSPSGTGAVCTDFAAVGTTVNAPMECEFDLECIRLVPTSGGGEPFDGELVELTDGSWAVQFMGVPNGQYTMKIGHCACDIEGGTEITVQVSAAKCGPPPMP